MASATGSTPWGVPKSCSKRSGSTSVACGRNEKMPPPSLSATTMVRSAARAPRVRRPLLSCSSAMSPISRKVGAWTRAPLRRPWTRHRRSRWHPGWTGGGGRPAGRRTTDVPTGIDDDDTSVAPSGSAATSARASAGSVGRSAAATTSSMAAWACSSARRQRAPRRPRSGPHAAGQDAADLCGLGHDAPGCGAFGIHPRRGRRHLHLLGTRRLEPLGQHLGRGRSTEAEDHGRRVVGREARMAQEVVERGHGGRLRGGNRTGDRPAPANRRPRPACTASGRPHLRRRR